ncbi:MAG: hypothetical protein Faunusvirus1_46 [Faunusvirus sp.]|jgi:ankyrin repeat protein|uniref:Uncharacterized protein n=1 Tax=Faunusvirus sp. TaxID=2487766 RepID=A0A3G4ZVX1_9VIRU|nr:MAG: hypothetical protein Faunusvirus1_46 [Faunusvirus sp.]
MNVQPITPSEWQSTRTLTALITSRAEKQCINYIDKNIHLSTTLLNYNFLPNADTFLILACRHSMSILAKKYIKLGIDINAQNKFGTTALIMANRYKLYDIVELLIKSGANLNLQTGKGSTALIKACARGNTDIALLLIKSGADINLNNKQNALMRAAESGLESVVNLLIDKGAQLDMVDDKGNTALMMSAQYTSFIGLKLIDVGAKLNIQNKLGETALIIACHNNCYPLIIHLINKGADLNICDNNGVSPFMLAIHFTSTYMAILMIKMGANINYKTTGGDTALNMLINRENIDRINFIDVLLEHNADVNILDNDNKNALYYAYTISVIRARYIPVVLQLLDKTNNFDCIFDDIKNVPAVINNKLQSLYHQSITTVANSDEPSEPSEPDNIMYNCFKTTYVPAIISLICDFIIIKK